MQCGIASSPPPPPSVSSIQFFVCTFYISYISNVCICVGSEKKKTNKNDRIKLLQLRFARHCSIRFRCKILVIISDTRTERYQQIKWVSIGKSQTMKNCVYPFQSPFFSSLFVVRIIFTGFCVYAKYTIRSTQSCNSIHHISNYTIYRFAIRFINIVIIISSPSVELYLYSVRIYIWCFDQFFSMTNDICPVQNL